MLQERQLSLRPSTWPRTGRWQGTRSPAIFSYYSQFKFTAIINTITTFFVIVSFRINLCPRYKVVLIYLWNYILWFIYYNFMKEAWIKKRPFWLHLIRLIYRYIIRFSQRNPSRSRLLARERLHLRIYIRGIIKPAEHADGNAHDSSDKSIG